MKVSLPIIQTHNDTRIMYLCIIGDHDICQWERNKGNYRNESGGRTPYCHDSVWCQCPCHDKRTKKYWILKRQFKMNILAFLKAGYTGVKDGFGYSVERRKQLVNNGVEG